jgi:hypothetical protein
MAVGEQIEEQLATVTVERDEAEIVDDEDVRSHALRRIPSTSTNTSKKSTSARSPGRRLAASL